MPINYTRRRFIIHSALGLSLPLCLRFPLFSQHLQNAPNGFHLTSRPWTPINTTKQELLDAIEGLCAFSIQHQNEQGAIIDPILNREHQYATPYFAHAVGTLVHAGRADSFLEHGIRAMNRSLEAVAEGNRAIPDQHGEFFIAPLATALSLYEPFVDRETLQSWKTQLGKPVTHIIESTQKKTNNWRTYAMKGEWLRAVQGLIPREEAISFIEDGWLNRTQRERIGLDKLHLYQDWNGHPQSHAVEAVGRGNLLALVEAGYNGPSANEIREFVEAGTAHTLQLQDPTGQCPPNGRTDNHVFNDVLYQLIFDVMAERHIREGDEEKAGIYRHAANLAFNSIMRWKRTDDPWTGSFYITKNHFDPEERIGYQPASQYSNYSGAVMYHLSEAYHTRKTSIPERPTASEIGGFVLETDERFGSVVANAGGMHVFANLRGDSVPKYETYWTPLGVMRFSRVNWDSRLGPSDGARDYLFEEAVSFGPTWKVGSEWVRLAMTGEHYQGTLNVDMQHPMLVKFSILYAPITGVGGPNFFHDFIVTPDGVLSTVRSPHNFRFGITLPLIEDDGRALELSVGNRIATTKYPEALGNGDQQHFIAVNQQPIAMEEEEPVQSTYGWLRPVRLTTEAEDAHVFTYPQSQEDPTATAVQQSFALTETGFTSLLGTVDGSMYTGRYSAGGIGNTLQLTDASSPDVELSEVCGFMVQHQEGKIIAIETDVDVTAHVQGKALSLKAYTKKEL